MSVLVAYIPVLHEGYWRFLQAHGEGARLFVIGPSLYSDYRPLAKDIRRLDASLVVDAVAAWGVCSEVSILDQVAAEALAAEDPGITLPAEDVSYQVVERFFGRCDVRYDTTFLRWDKSRSAQLLVPHGRPALAGDAVLAEMVVAAEQQAQGSVDWWRQVGACLRFRDGTMTVARNEHQPHSLSPYAVGDPRANFHKGVRIELSTATHAEAKLIAQAARQGLSTEGASMYVTDFPCPPCAKLLATAGIAKLYFRRGYTMLDGEQVLEGAGVEIVQIGERDGN